MIGADQAISVQRALEAVTIDAARQVGQPDRLGSLEAGKEADFTILDQADASDLMGISRAALGYADLKNAPRSAPRFPRAETLQAMYSRQVNTERPLVDLLGEQWPHFLAWTGDIERLFGDYVRRKAERNLLDYDDLL